MAPAEAKGGVGGERIHLAGVAVFERHFLTVDEELEALFGFCLTIVGEHDVEPFFHGERVLAHGFDAVLIPLVDEVAADAVILDPDVPAPVAVPGVHAGDDGAVGFGAETEVATVSDLITGFELGEVAKVDVGSLELEGVAGIEGDGWPGCVDGALVEGELFIGDGEREGEIGLGGEIGEVFRGEGGEPGVEVRVGRFFPLTDGLVRLGDLSFEGFPRVTVFGEGDEDVGRVIGLVPVHGGHGGVPEVGGEGVEVFLGDGVELVIVAGGASGGEAEPDGGSCFDLVLGINGLVFLRDGSALAGGGEAAVESGGDDLVELGVGEEVAGDLFDGEIPVGFVFGEGLDDPVTVGPDVAVVVDVDAV